MRDPLKHKFSTQRCHAKYRNIDWQLTYKEWLEIWGDKISNRGRGKHKLVMARKFDQGPYAVGNVYIQELYENSKDASKFNPRFDLTVKDGVTIKCPNGEIKNFPNLKTASRELNLSYDMLWQRRQLKKKYKGYEFL